MAEGATSWRKGTNKRYMNSNVIERVREAIENFSNPY